MAFFLGIDAGGSRTRGAVGDQHRVLGRAETSSSKIQRVGEAEARRALRTVIEETCKSAGVRANSIEQVCIGISGFSDPGVAETVRSIVGEIVPAPVEVVGDMMIALEAAFGALPGCIVNAGTGSFALGRNERCIFARVGGWGPAISDEGSGYWIGRAAVAAVLRAHDSGKSTALAGAITQAWHLTTYEDFVRVAIASPPPDFAQLFPTVLREAEQGDPIACEVLERAGVEVAELARLAIGQLWPDSKRVRVAILGGVLESSWPTRRAFAASLRSSCPGCAISFGNVEPVLGAVAIARKHAAVSTHGKPGRAPHSATELGRGV
jgi:N-acetylglucosamine kinase-like BadF-type ATPase